MDSLVEAKLLLPHEADRLEKVDFRLNEEMMFFFIFIAALEGHTLVHFGEEIISIMSGTYYIDYSSSVLACTVYLHVLEMI